MKTKSYTEDEFKQILKNLFSEKKRVDELKKQLKEKSPQDKFHAKVEKLQNLALEEELIRIKTALVESEKQNQQLSEQLEKSKPALQKLNQDCRELQARCKESEEAKVTLLEESKKEKEERESLAKKLENLERGAGKEREEKEHLQANYEKLEKAYQQNQRHFREESEEHFSQMRILTEKLAAVEHQLKQTDLAKVHEEYEQKIALMKEEHKELAQKLNSWVAEARAEKDLVCNELTHVKKEATHALEKKEKVTLQLSEKVARLEEEKERLRAALEEKQEVAASFQKGIKELTERLEESDAEVHKAQVHLAKKVKESTLYQDVANRQKEQILEDQKLLAKEKERRMQLEKSLEAYQEKESKLNSYTKQCTEEARAHITELERRSFSLEKEVSRQKELLVELEEYKTRYEKMRATFNDLKRS